MRISNNSTGKTIVLGKDKGYDARFSDIYTIYSNPIQTFNYTDPASVRFSEYKDQSYTKIYFTPEGMDFHLGDYLIIEGENYPHVTLLHKDVQSKEQTRYYYTAE